MCQRKPCCKSVHESQQAYAAIRTHPLKSCLYLLALPLAMSPLAILGSIFAMYSTSGGTCLNRPRVFDVSYHTGGTFLSAGNGFAWRQPAAVWKYCDVTLVRRWLFGWHILSYCILPPFGWALFHIPFPGDPKNPFMGVTFAIYSSGFYLMALVPALLLVNRVLGRD